MAYIIIIFFFLFIIHIVNSVAKCDCALDAYNDIFYSDYFLSG